MITVHAKKIIVEALFNSKGIENREIMNLQKKIRQHEINIRVLDDEIKRLERMIERETGGNLAPDTPETYHHKLTWSDKIAFVLRDEEEGLKIKQIAEALKLIDDELVMWDNPTLIGRISAIISVNRQNRFERVDRLVKLKKAELTAS